MYKVSLKLGEEYFLSYEYFGGKYEAKIIFY